MLGANVVTGGAAVGVVSALELGTALDVVAVRRGSVVLVEVVGDVVIVDGVVGAGLPPPL